MDLDPAALRLTFCDVTLVPDERLVLKAGEPVRLTPKAFDLLAVLASNPGRLLTKEQLMQAVWGDTAVEESNLSYHVYAIRKALGDTAENGHLIETVPKRGYRFGAAVERVDAWNGVEPDAPGRDPASETPPLQPHSKGKSVESSGAPRLYRFARRWAVVGFACGLAGVWFLRGSSPGPGPKPESLHATPLTSMAGVVREPSMSPDGNDVVFSWTGGRGDNPDLYVQHIGSGEPLRLTTDPRNDYSPSWSPDGRTIAFLRGSVGGITEIRLIAPFGGADRKVADIQPRSAFYRPTSLSWCPDSGCLVVTDSPGVGKSDALFAVAIDSGDKRQLTYPPGQVGLDADPAISPDGRSLVFRRDSTAFSGAYYRLALKEGLVPDGDPVRRTSTLMAGKPAWAPDNRDIVFSARGALWRLSALGVELPTRLPFIGEDGVNPVFSRTADGRQRLVYARSFADVNVWRVDTLAAGAAASALPVVAVASTRIDSLANLSPGGGRLAFLSNRTGESEIWVADTDGSHAVQLTSLAKLPGFPRWSPDGRFLTFHGDPYDRPDVLVVPAEGGTPKVLTNTLPNAGFPSFSRDGRWIYFCVLQEGLKRIWKIPVAGGEPVPVTTGAGALAIESYDGRDLFYVEAAERPSALWRVPVAGGVPVKVVDGVVFGNFDVTQGGIYYIDRVAGETGAFFTDRPGGDNRLRYFDFATGRSTTIASNLGAVTFGLSASRDGRMIFFSRVDSAVDELMLVENFR